MKYRDFSRFDIEDFAFDESFQKWAINPHSDEEGFWRGYMDEHPYQIDKILAARELVIKLREQKFEEEEEVTESIWKGVVQHIDRNSFFRFNKFEYLSAAAIILITIVLGVGLYVSLRQNKTSDPHQAILQSDGLDLMLEVKNEEDSTIAIILPDGSSVNLETGSTLNYPRIFRGKNRIVHLKGEAFFDIEKNPGMPFVIFANNTAIKVLGTSFRVNADTHSARISVSVRTGQVSVLEKSEFERSAESAQLTGLILTPNQEAEVVDGLKEIKKTLTREPRLVDPGAYTKFEFNHAPLTDVFATFEKAYGIDFIYNKELLMEKHLNVNLADEGLFEKLDIICLTMGLSYQVVDARIIIELQ